MRQWPEEVEGGNTCRRRIARGEADDKYGPLPTWGSSGGGDRDSVLGGGGAKGGGGGGDGACEKETTGRSMISHRSAIHFALNIGPPKHKVPKSGRDTHEHRAGATRLAYSSV